MATTQIPVRVADIADIVAAPERGVISLVGDHGGLSLITGEIVRSSMMMGTIAFETEHGTVYLDPEAEVMISEETPVDEHHEWLVEWSIDGHGPSPEAAAARVWTQIFGRTVAGDDDACFFTVTDPKTGKSAEVDLKDHDLDALVAP